MCAGLGSAHDSGWVLRRLTTPFAAPLGCDNEANPMNAGNDKGGRSLQCGWDVLLPKVTSTHVIHSLA